MKTATILQFPLQSTLHNRMIESLPETDGLAEIDKPIQSHYKKEGSKYQETKDLFFCEVVKLIRKDIKSKFTVKNGWKFSITSESGRYSAINLRILKAPVNAESEDFKIWSELNCGASMLDAPTRYTQEFDNAHNEIKKIIESYDFDDSDSMTDYFHSRFYSHIYIDIK